jgi:hypoxanthine phosphoribosyltransferase
MRECAGPKLMPSQCNHVKGKAGASGYDAACAVVRLCAVIADWWVSHRVLGLQPSANLLCEFFRASPFDTHDHICKFDIDGLSLLQHDRSLCDRVSSCQARSLRDIGISPKAILNRASASSQVDNANPARMLLINEQRKHAWSCGRATSQGDDLMILVQALRERGELSVAKCSFAMLVPSFDDVAASKHAWGTCVQIDKSHRVGRVQAICKHWPNCRFADPSHAHEQNVQAKDSCGGPSVKLALGVRWKTMVQDIASILVSEAQIAQRVRELGAQLSKDINAACAADISRGIEPRIIIIPVLTGSMVFVADLVRQLPFKLRLQVVSASSYPGTATSSKGVTLHGNLPESLDGAHVVLVDDIFDSGQTLSLLSELLQKKSPASLRTVVLLAKPGKAKVEFRPNYVGFEIPDRFVVGYGLDYDGYYRNYPAVGVLKESVT